MGNQTSLKSSQGAGGGGELATPTTHPLGPPLYMPQRTQTFRHKGTIWRVESKFFFDYKLNLFSYSYKKDCEELFAMHSSWNI